MDLDARELLPLGDMLGRIAEACRRLGRAAPRTRGEVVRCVVDSLAPSYRRAVRRAAGSAGRAVDVARVVGRREAATGCCAS
ncbi:hypothetical protein [Amycolatopsis benzoatilytica]|uniref:hypothetical protein n=1 Tax=Amycolatopsis benzoatilytica TaxID=346045 RepID=UPI0003A09C0A|nr:hypothetical protein [Amycolatopsis benzoatilytica]